MSEPPPCPATEPAEKLPAEQVKKKLKSFKELKEWDTQYQDEGWTGKLVGLSWSSGKVTETWQWVPPQEPQTAEAEKGEKKVKT